MALSRESVRYQDQIGKVRIAADEDQVLVCDNGKNYVLPENVSDKDQAEKWTDRIPMQS